MTRLPFDVPGDEGGPGPDSTPSWDPTPDEFDPIEEPIDDEVELAPPRRRFGRRSSARPSASAAFGQSLPLRLALGGAVIFVSGLLTTAGAKTEYAKIVAETLKSKQAPGWLSLDLAGMKGRKIAEPTLEGAEAFFDPNVIVEYYSR